MKRIYALLLALGVIAACAQPAPAPAPQPTPAATTTTETAPAVAETPAPPPRVNPFFEASTLPYQAPRFDLIRDEDYQPALEEGMRQQIAEIDAIANSADAPTFENTITAMERSGQLLTRTAKVFFNLSQSNTNETMQKVEEEEAPKLTRHQDSIYLNPKLFARVKAIYDARETLNLDPESKFLAERYYKGFVRAGALLSEEDKTKLRALNEEESKLTTEFRKRVLADTDAGAIVISDKAELAGLTEQDIASAAQKAKDRNLEGKWVLTLQNTTQQPLLASLENRDVRTRLFNASVARGNHGGPNDTREIVTRLAQLRADKAKLLGFANYAAFSLDDQMAKTPENAIKLMTSMVPASTGKGREEAAKMQKLIDKEKGGFKLGPQDWEYYSEKVRKAEYNLDEEQIKPYFELNHVIRDGLFYAANQLYGITFKERKDLPTYNPDVQVFEVFNEDGTPLALWYADYYARPNKSGGAWMDTFVDQSSLMGTKPVVVNVGNFQKPAPGHPSLLTSDDVTTMFHEFGHALHGMFSNVHYPTFSGANTPRDFVEFPSQINEHWAYEPRVLANYAKRWDTGEPMPQALVDKIKKTSTFNQGYAMTEYLSAALLDQAWHSIAPGSPLQDVNTFEPAALKKYKVAMTEIPPRYHTTYFSHIWGGGYSAGYYAYLWSEVIDHDAFYWFKEHGGMTRANGQRFRDMILSRGGSEPQAAMYRAFRGRDPIVEPLLIERGLKKAPTAPTRPKK